MRDSKLFSPASLYSVKFPLKRFFLAVCSVFEAGPGCLHDLLICLSFVLEELLQLVDLLLSTLSSVPKPDGLTLSASSFFQDVEPVMDLLSLFHSLLEPESLICQQQHLLCFLFSAKCFLMEVKFQLFVLLLSEKHTALSAHFFVEMLLVL